MMTTTVQPLSKDLLIAGAQEVFETMAFMGIEPAISGDLEIEGPATLGIISFTGPVEGYLAVSVSDECASAVAANMLGLSRPQLLSSEMVDDAVGEITNMVMGLVKANAEVFHEVQVSIPLIIHGHRMNHELSDRPNRIDAVALIDDQHTAQLSLLWRERFDVG